MKISYNWLRDYVDIQKSPEQLAEDLSLFGHEVESIEKVGDDTVIDFEITPNRGDCLSILGIAREITALYNLKIHDNTSILRSIKESTENIRKINVEISDPKICPRFTARIIDGIKIGGSPKWMQKRLDSYGFRPVNNIVDITNYVMVATGQPLHSFDYAKLKSKNEKVKMLIRRGRKGEKVVTLDGVERDVDEDVIVAERDGEIVDLVGIMGAKNSEVDEKTKTIILQGAIFDPALIRRASKHLNHTTDASYRYERGVDYEGTIRGVEMAAKLIQESCSEAKVGELVDIISQKPAKTKIELDLEKVNKLLGVEVNLTAAKEFLERLNFNVLVVDSRLMVSVPSFRVFDVKIWQDLAEEIARMYGYNQIKRNYFDKEQSKKENKDWIKRESIKDILSNLGLTEVYSYSFAEKKEIELSGDKIADCVEMASPLSPETQFLRPSILPSLLKAIAKNPWAPEANIFEIEKVFNQEKEWWQLGMATTGKKDSLLIKALEALKVKDQIQTVDQKILDSYKIRRPVKYLILDLDDIKWEFTDYRLEASKNQYRPISKFPPTVRDLAFIVEDKTNTQAVENVIKTISNQILIVELFDEFSSDKFGKGKKNVAYHIWLQDLKRPMEEKEVEEIIDKIIQEVENKYNAKLRK